MKTGKTQWTERLGDACWGSILHADGRLYVTDLQGETYVVAAKPTYQLLERNQLNEQTLASPAASDGEIFIRTYKQLWCISAKK